jgi:glycosyltransferase involved in cell wall biosynthesis
MNVSVGIVTRNGTKATIGAAFSALGGTDDVLVVNNDCHDAHLLAMRTLAATTDGIRLVDFDKSMGLAKCFNTILRAAKHDWVVIANDDVRFDKGWKDTLLATMKECSKAQHIVMAYPRNRYACFAMSKALVARIGWWDERFTGYFYEDEDWHLRLSEATGRHVGKDWVAGRRDGIMAICECVLHDQKLQDSGAGGGLSAAANAEHFKRKWAACDDGWWTKGKVDGRYRKMRRVLPEVATHGEDRTPC